MSPQIQKLNVGGDVIGLRSVDEAFQSVWSRRLVGGKAAEKLFEIVSQKNYIAEGCEQEYKVALLEAYERHFDIGKDETYQGKEYTTPPKGMIIDAIMREVYAGSKGNADTPSKTKGVPENLKKFFTAKQRKENAPLQEAIGRFGTSTSQDSGSC